MRGFKTCELVYLFSSCLQPTSDVLTEIAAVAHDGNPGQKMKYDSKYRNRDAGSNRRHRKPMEDGDRMFDGLLLKLRQDLPQ